MAETISSSNATKRYAVVTGANKGIGLGTCRKLASNGVTVVLTARDEKRGLEAVENLTQSGLSDVVFHQLDVTDPASIASLAEFIKTHFGKLDILVNNAGHGGNIIDPEAFKALKPFGDHQVGDLVDLQQLEDEVDLQKLSTQFDWKKMMKETYELGEECLKTNYFGAKEVTEALLPLLQLSNSPRIVNVSSSMAKLKNFPTEKGREVLNDVDSLTEEKLDELLKEFLKDFKENQLQSKGWPTYLSAYTVSKAAISAYTRILAKKLPTFCINCVCPGYVKTDLTCNTGFLTADDAAEFPVSLALLPDGGPSGQFFVLKELSSFD